LPISDIQVAVLERELTEAAKSIVVQPQAEIPDLHWGIIFYDLDDHRVASLYLDHAGSRGAVGDAPVSFRGKFFKWISNNFSSGLQ
jgi:hypothetical protein